MRKVPHFLKKNPNYLWIRLVFWGRKWLFFYGKIRANFADFRFFFVVRKYFADLSAKENCHFRPQEMSRIWREIGIFLRKCGFFLMRRLRFSRWSGYLGDQPAPQGELQSSDEEKTTFFEQNPDFLVKLGFRNWLKIREFSLFLGTPAGTWDDLPKKMFLRKFFHFEWRSQELVYF